MKMLILLSCFVMVNASAQPQKQGVMPGKMSPAPVAPVASAVVKLPAATPAPTPEQTAVVSSAVDAILNEDLIKALRDPFQIPTGLITKKEAPKTDLETYPLKDIKLNGVIMGPKKTRAMVSLPNSKVYFVKIGESVGTREGKITAINGDSIQITEYYTDEHGKRFPDVYQIGLTGELTSLSKKEE